MSLSGALIFFDHEASLEMRINVWFLVKPHFVRRDGDEDPGDMAQTKKQNHCENHYI